MRIGTAPATPGPKSASVAEGSRLTRDELRALKSRDNFTNFRFIAGIYFVILVTAFCGIWAWESYAAGELGLVWLIAISVVAILSMGASQHQFGGVIHEATHYMLFDNRKLNELASDWLAGFPIYTSTQAYRVHHFAHHQFVNDPDRDPIAKQAAESGHWLDFPVTHFELLKGFARLVWPVNLLRYMIARAKHSALPQDTNPYSDEEHVANPWTVRTGILFAVGLPLAVVPLVLTNNFVAAAAVLGAAWIAMVTFYVVIPEEAFPRSRVRPVISDRATIIGRMSFLAAIYAVLTFGQFATGAPVWGYFGLFWILPLLTAFPIFMVLREWVQHGNADRGRLTNSRVFLVGPVSRYAVFPLGMDYHLPHHLFASVPHYNLKELHAFLLRDPEYVEKGRVVEGWVGHSKNGDPSIVEVVGPRYAVGGNDIYVDENALEEADVQGAERVDEHVAASRRGRVW